MADVLLARIAKQAEFRLIGPEDSSVQSNPMQSDRCRLCQVAEFSFACFDPSSCKNLVSDIYRVNQNPFGRSPGIRNWLVKRNPNRTRRRGPWMTGSRGPSSHGLHMADQFDTLRPGVSKRAAPRSRGDFQREPFL